MLCLAHECQPCLRPYLCGWHKLAQPGLCQIWICCLTSQSSWSPSVCRPHRRFRLYLPLTGTYPSWNSDSFSSETLSHSLVWRLFAFSCACLENICRVYLHYRDHGEHDKAVFVVSEQLDLCSWRRTAGEPGRYPRNLKCHSDGNASRIAFVRDRTAGFVSTASCSEAISRLAEFLSSLDFVRRWPTA